MNIRQFEVLRTLIATGSTIAAAKVMGISQSGVSRLLQQLESDLSILLFVREKGRLIPTPEAEILARDADNILFGVERFTELVNDLRNGSKGPEMVRIGLPNSMWESFAPAMLVEYERKFPGVKVETFFETTTTIIRMMEQRVIDFGFLRYEGEIPPFIAMEAVATSINVCVMHKEHHLASKEQISPADLRGEPLIMLGRMRQHRISTDEAFRQAGVRQNIRIETHSNSSACAYAAHGLGIAIASSFYANLYKDLPIIQRPFLPVNEHMFGIARPVGVPLSLAGQALMDALKRQVKRSQL